MVYIYSAAAATLNGVPQPLPTGVLDLYSDGTLACSINVGGSATGGNCAVTYSAVGAHQVITDYQSGAASSTETDVETIPPFTTATTATMSETYSQSGAYGESYHVQPAATIADEHGNALAPGDGVTYALIDRSTGATLLTFVPPDPNTPARSDFTVWPDPDGAGNMTITAGPPWAYQPKTVYAPASDTLAVLATYPGVSGYTGSSSAPAAVSLTH